MDWKVPFFDLHLGTEERDAVLAVLDSNWLTMGDQTPMFETAFAALLGDPAPHAVAVTNGTAALHLALAALDVGPGDEVICPSLTFIATANAARYVGAGPVFADVRSADDWTIDPDDVAAKITPRTRAIVVVHYGGYACDMDPVMAIAHEHGLDVVEDASHAPLATDGGRALGTIGDIGCFSFYSNKNLTTGEGGMAVTADEALGERMRLMRSHAMTSSAFERFQGHAFGYDVETLGYNYRIDEMRAALGRAQIGGLAAATARRRELTLRYRTRLTESAPAVVMPFAGRERESACHILPVALPENGPGRDSVMEELARQGVQTSIHYRPLHHLSVFRDGAQPLPVTDALADRILTLPLYPGLGDDDIDMIVDALARSIAAQDSS